MSTTFPNGPDFRSEAPEIDRPPRLVTDASGGWILYYDTADFGPVVEIDDYVNRKGFVRRRYVISSVMVSASGRCSYFGVRLNAKGCPDRRAISPIGGMHTRYVSTGVASAAETVGFHVGSWGLAG